MKKVFLFLAAGVISSGYLTAQNSHNVSTSGKDEKMFEKKFSNSVTVSSDNKERTAVVMQDGKVLIPYFDSPQNSKNTKNSEITKIISEINEEQLNFERQNGNVIGQNENINRPPEFTSNIVKPLERNFKTTLSVINSERDDVATVTFIVVGNFNEGGYHLLLDADAEMYDFFPFYQTGYNWKMVYEACEYKIPENASSDLSIQTGLLDDQVSIDIPEGIYDFAFLRLTPEWNSIGECSLFINGARNENPRNDFEFKAGYEYIFTTEFNHAIEFNPENDATLTKIALPLTSTELTNQENITVVIFNAGIAEIEREIELTYRINNGTWIPAETFIVSLESGKEITYVFNTKADFSETGIYNVEAKVIYDLDLNSTNDKIASYTKNPQPRELPFIDNFEAPENLLLNWTVIDANDDADERGGTFMYSGIPGVGGTFGLVSLNSPQQAADDYLISDPVIIPAIGTYHIEFYAYSFTKQTVKLLYGTSLDYENMELLENIPVNNSQWEIKIVNFDFEPGTFYFAIHSDTQGMLNIDNVTIDAGQFIGKPDISFNKVFTPTWGCDLTGEEIIGAEVKNIGTENIQVFTLTYQIGESTTVSQTFNETIEKYKSKTVYFNQLADFSATGEYTVRFTASTPDEVNIGNNEIEATVNHFAPITELPFYSDFSNNNDVTNWYPKIENEWTWDSWQGSYNCSTPNVPLISRCVAFESGEYQFTFNYSAGGWFGGSDFYVTYGKSGTDPSSWLPVKWYIECNTNYEMIEDEIKITVNQSGEYVFAIMPVYESLYIYSVNFDKIYIGDVYQLPFTEDFGYDSSTPDEFLIRWNEIKDDVTSISVSYHFMEPSVDGFFGCLEFSNGFTTPGIADTYIITKNPIKIQKTGMHHISFFLRNYGDAGNTGSMRVLYGNSPNPVEMEVLADYPVMSEEEWDVFYISFDITSIGNYYFAFNSYTSVPDYGFNTLYLDNIVIDKGEFEPKPDIRFIKILNLHTSCDLPIEGAIGAEIINMGTGPLSEFTLSYQIGDSSPIIQIFTDPVEITKTITVYFNETADFSNIGDYNIKFAASAPSEVNIANNEAEVNIKHVLPITSLPFIVDFSNAEDFNYWHSGRADGSGWSMNYENGSYDTKDPVAFSWEQKELNAPLVSGCFTLEPGTYRFSYRYKSGVRDSGFTFAPSFYIAYGKSGTDPLTFERVKFHEGAFTYYQIVEDDVFITIHEPGEYVFAFITHDRYITVWDDSALFQLYGTSLSYQSSHDFIIKGIGSPGFARLTPKYQIAETEKTFTAVLQNKGNTANESGNIKLLFNNNEIANQDFSFTETAETISVELKPVFGNLSAGPLGLKFEASITGGISKELEILKTVSDTIYAWDNIDGGFDDGFSVLIVGAGIGLIYELEKPDILTSITVGFAWHPDYPGNVFTTLAVYEVNENYEIGRMIFEKEVARTSGNNTVGITYDVPDIELQPGKYFFEVRQTDDRWLLYIAYDSDINGHVWYNNSMENEFYKLETLYGYIHVRPNFGNPPVGVSTEKVSDSQLTLYPNPARDELRVENGELRMEKIVIYNAIGQVVINVSDINETSYKLNVEGLSAGLYFISVQTKSGVVNGKFVKK